MIVPTDRANRTTLIVPTDLIALAALITIVPAGQTTILGRRTARSGLTTIHDRQVDRSDLTTTLDHRADLIVLARPTTRIGQTDLVAEAAAATGAATTQHIRYW